MTRRSFRVDSVHDILSTQIARARGLPMARTDADRRKMIDDFVGGAAIVDEAWADRARTTIRQLGLPEESS